MDCKFVRQHLDAYVDAELEPTPVIDFERHLDVCSGCRNELSVARLVQRTMRELPREAAPPVLKMRIQRALDEAASPQQPFFIHARGPFAGVLAAAGMLMLVAGAVVRNDGGGARGPGVAADLAPDVTPVRLLGDVVARHTDQLPTEVAADRPEQVTNWFRGKVGFRVRSVEFTEPKVQIRFMGARMSHIGDRQAAKLYYSVGDSRLTGVVFQSPPSLQRVLHDDQLIARLGAHRERIGSRVVTYQNVQGYTVPILEHDGITYAFTGDLDQRQLLQLVASARLP
jgi:anti-sigma factor RsiW